MKKVVLILSMVLISCSAYAGDNAQVYFDVLAHFTRQISTPTLNMAGGSLSGAYMFTPQVGAEAYFGLDMYSVTFAGGSEYNYKDFNYGAGVRFYLVPQLYLKGDFGRLYRKASTAAASTTESDWRYGGGVAYILPMSSKMWINVGADFYRYNTSKANMIVANAGLTFGF